MDLDWNLVQNLVESFNSQEGNAGPTTNLLSMLGGSLPAGATQRREPLWGEGASARVRGGAIISDLRSSPTSTGTHSRDQADEVKCRTLQCTMKHTGSRFSFLGRRCMPHLYSTPPRLSSAVQLTGTMRRSSPSSTCPSASPSRLSSLWRVPSV